VPSGRDPLATRGFVDDAVAALLGREPSGGRGRAIPASTDAASARVLATVAASKHAAIDLWD
jgi:hypothetical protein